MSKRKGYQRPVRSLVAEFSDGDLAGLEVTLRTNPSMRFFLDTLAGWADEDADKSFDAVLRRTEDFAAGALLGWNLVDDDGKPVPATPAEFTERLGVADTGQLIARWLREVRSVPESLAPPSESGDTSEALPE